MMFVVGIFISHNVVRKFEKGKSENIVYYRHPEYYMFSCGIGVHSRQLICSVVLLERCCV